jgi:uncharacterized membrane protein
MALAKGLGWFSVGLGVTELAAPRALARLIGIDEGGRTPLVIRALGLRELASGIGIFGKPRRAAPVWSRVLGDVIDLGMLAYAMKARRTRSERLVAAIVSVVGVSVLDVIAGQRLQRNQQELEPPVTRLTTINREPAEVYAYWRNFEQLPQFMRYLESVTELDDRRSHWVAKLPTGNRIEWDAEITEDRPGERISWRSTSGMPVRGTVSFQRAPLGRGTEVRVQMQIGANKWFGGLLAKLFAGPEIDGDLRRFKQVLETGEIMRSDTSIYLGPHPAQPPGNVENSSLLQKGLVP